jgi:hypothetical protein
VAAASSSVFTNALPAFQHLHYRLAGPLRHVRASRTRGLLRGLVTFNIGDFPEAALKPYDVAAIHPDEFLLDQLDLYPDATVEVLRQQAASYRRVPNTVPDILVLLERTGVPRFAAEVRSHLQPPPAW